jgi:hypothetical protein
MRVDKRCASTQRGGYNSAVCHGICTQKGRTWDRTSAALFACGLVLVMSAVAVVLMRFGVCPVGVCARGVEPVGVCARGVEAVGVPDAAAALGILRRFQVTYFDVFLCFHIGSLVVLFRVIGLRCVSGTEQQLTPANDISFGN